MSGKKHPQVLKIKDLNPWTSPVSAALLKDAPPLGQRFYERPALEVAPDLLGKVIVTKLAGEITAAIIIEVEAYLGADDPASHAFPGKTPRNYPMFSLGGIAYVYLSYGMHRCVNVVTGRKDAGEAVLLRAAIPLFNLETMAKRRKIPFEKSLKVLKALASGPGKLSQAMGMSLADNERRWNHPDFKIIDLGYEVHSHEILSSPRIGISKAVERPWRFFMDWTPSRAPTI